MRAQHQSGPKFGRGLRQGLVKRDRAPVRSGKIEMKRKIHAFAATGGLLIALSIADPTCAQKSGGTLKMYNPDSPASMSIHEEATIVSERPMMGVFNNLVMFDQHVPQ